MMNEKQVSYQSVNTYSTLNDYTAKTENVWVVFHGIGYLSKYFLKYFRHLNQEKNYIIAPQAPSKYYLNEKYEHVGASWATRENTEQEIKNLLAYLDEVYKNEDLKNSKNLFFFGYSQGVSIVTRWMAQRKIQATHLILNSGRIPTELAPADFAFFEGKVSFIYGEDDPFVNKEFLEQEEKRIRDLFPKNLEFIPFAGGHEVNKEVILKLVGE
jgi:predicted esterase